MTWPSRSARRGAYRRDCLNAEKSERQVPVAVEREDWGSVISPVAERPPRRGGPHRPGGSCSNQHGPAREEGVATRRPASSVRHRRRAKGPGMRPSGARWPGHCPFRHAYHSATHRARDDKASSRVRARVESTGFVACAGCRSCPSDELRPPNQSSALLDGDVAVVEVGPGTGREEQEILERADII